MRVLFLAPNLREGGGVSDYTLRLARALRDSGDDARCVSLNERNDEVGDHDCMGKGVSWRSRMTRLQEVLDEFAPDIVSLQYAPYGFHPKGLAVGLPGLLSSLKGTFRWHIMFHELWIGEEAHYSPLQRLVGAVQRRIVSGFRRLHPALIHTSNEEYQRRLGTIGLRAAVLPLFGNIPIALGDPLIRSALMLRAVPVIQSHETFWIMVFFGGLLPEWDPGALLRYLRNELVLAKRDRCLLVRLGKSGRNGEKIWRALLDEATPDFSFLELGEATPEFISCHLRAADFGVVTTPLHLLGKSGSAAAMREHGLPLIAVRGIRSSTCETQGDVLIPGDSPEGVLMKTGKGQPKERLNEIAQRFRADLQSLVS